MALTNKLMESLADAKLVTASLFGASAFALGAAYTAQYGFDMQPCTLCLYQRAPFAVIMVLSALGFLLAGRKPKFSALLVFMSAVVFLIGAAIAFYHAGVEQHWWVSALEGCKMDFKADSAKSLLEKLQTLSAVKCDEIAWKDPVLGLSMAAWNAIISAGLSVTSLVSSILIARKANGMLY